MDSYGYRDSTRESRRREEINAKKLRKVSVEKQQKSALPNTPWSAKVERREKKEERQVKKQKLSGVKGRPSADSSDEEDLVEDWKAIVTERKASKARPVQKFEL